MENVSSKRVYAQDLRDLNFQPQFTLVSAVSTIDVQLQQISIYDLLSVELQSPKLVIINAKGGIKSVNHVYIDRNKAITNQIEDDHKSKIIDEDLIKFFLRKNDNKSCAIVSSQESHQNLVQNLITEKPISLACNSVKTIPHPDNAIIPPTMFRINIGCETFDSLDMVDMEKLQSLLKQSFQKTPSGEYWALLARDLLSITIAGNYDGALIVTSHRDHVYLDKFAIHPNSQGLGVADLLWNKLLQYDDVFWRSRVGNPVNKWYFDRADGFLTKDKWTLFFFGPRGLSSLKQYLDIVESIPPTFAETPNISATSTHAEIADNILK